MASASGTSAAIQDDLLVVDAGSLRGHELEKEVSLALLPQIEISDEIVEFLAKSKSLLLSPLQFFKGEAPVPTQRTQLAKGSIQVRQDGNHLSGLPVNPTIQQHVTQMSDDLQLSEATCLKYWILASQPENRHLVAQRNRLSNDSIQENVPQAAREFVLQETNAVLSALNQLCRARLDESLPLEKREVIVSFTNGLLQEDLVGNLVGLLNDTIPAFLKRASIQKYAINWQKTIAEILFILALSSHFIAAEIKSLAQLMKALAIRFENTRSQIASTLQSVMGLGSSTDNMPFDAKETASLLHTVNFVQASFASVLLQDIHRFNRNTGEFGAPTQPLLSTSIIQELNTLILQEKWIAASTKIGKIQGVVGFYYTNYLAKTQFNDPRVSSFHTECVEANCFSFLTQALLPFAPPTNDILSKSYYLISQDVFVVYNQHFFSVNPAPVVEATTQEHHALSAVTSGDSVLNIFDWVTILCEQCPSLSTLIWSSPLVDTFLGKCSDILLTSNEPTRIAFMHLLAVAGQGNPAAAYKFIKDSPPPITWKRFFSAIESYRRHLMPESHHTTAAPQNTKLATSHKFSSLEVDALEAMFHIFKTMVQDKTIVHYFLDWPDVNVLLLFLGFVRCPIPSILKGAVMETLSSFVNSAPMGQLMWQHMESAQILLTTPVSTLSPSTTPNQGILYELEQIESMQRKYPATLGFLKLLTNVFKYEFPEDCGASYRIPGAQPYLEFVLHVFLKADSREYDDEQEKWQVYEQCLLLFDHIISNYKNNDSDFKDEFVLLNPHMGFNKNDKYYSKPKSLGYLLISKLLSDSPLLRKLLQLLSGNLSVYHLEHTSEEVKVKYTTDLCLQLVQEVVLNAKPILAAQENCVQLALNIVHRVCEQGPSFVDAARVSGIEVVVEPLPRLLARTPQHIVTLAKYIRYFTSPQISILSAKILQQLSLHLPPTQLVKLFQDHRADQDLRDGYVSVILDEKNSNAKQVVFDLLIENVSKAVPNISTLLLMELDANNCLDALLLVLDNLNFVHTQPLLAKCAHQLLHKVVSNPKLNVIAHLDGFFSRQMKTLPTLLSIQRHLKNHRDVLSLVEIRQLLLQDVSLFVYQTKKADVLTGGLQTLLTLLDATQFVHIPPTMPSDSAGIKLADQCTVENEQRLFIDVMKFQSALQAETSSPLVQWALSWNRYSERISVESSALEAWSSLVQVLVADQHLQVKEMYQLWQVILAKSKTKDAVAYLVEVLSKVTVTLSFQCRALRVYRPSATFSTFQRMELIQETINVITGTVNSTGNPAAARRARSWLYTSLLHLVRYGLEEDSKASSDREALSHLVLKSNKPTLLDEFVWNESFLSLVCRDACEGTDPLSMGQAMNVLTLILSTSSSGRAALLRLLQAAMPHLCNLFFQLIQSNQDGLVDTVASFFIQLAQTQDGALVLLHGGVVRTLMQCTTFPLQRPQFMNDMESWVDSEQKYYQKWLPILRLLGAITASLSQNSECIQAVLIFLHKHIKLVSGALNLEVHHLSLQRLMEMSHLAHLFRITAAHPSLLESLLGAPKVIKLTQKLVTIVSYYGNDLGSFNGWWNQVVPRNLSEQEQADTPLTVSSISAITSLFDQTKWDTARLLLCQAIAFCRIRLLSWDSPLKRKSDYIAIPILENDSQTWLACLRTWVVLHDKDIEKEATLFLIENIFTILAHHALHENNPIAATAILSSLGPNFENYALIHLLSRKLRDISQP